MEISLLKLRRGSLYLPPPNRELTLSSALASQNVDEWWKESSEEFKKKVLAKQDKVYDIEAIGIVIAKLDDVTIFSHEYGEKHDKHTNPQVIANEDVASITTLKKTSRVPKIGEMAYMEWVDATHNNSPATLKDLETAEGIVKVIQLGFLLHLNEERIFTGGRYTKGLDRYKYLSAVPACNVKELVALET